MPLKIELFIQIVILVLFSMNIAYCNNQQQFEIKQISQKQLNHDANQQQQKKHILTEDQCGQMYYDNVTILKKIKLNLHLLDNTLSQNATVQFYMFIDSKDQGLSLAIRNHIYPTKIIQTMIAYIDQQQNILYVGSHSGIQTLTLAKYIQMQKYRDIHIYTFEPNELYYILLIKSVYLNGLEDYVSVFKCAVSDVNGKAELAIRNKNTAAASIVQLSGDIEFLKKYVQTRRKADNKYEVQTFTLDYLHTKITSIEQNKGQSLESSELNGQIKSKNKRMSFIQKIGLVYISANTYQIQVMIGMKSILNNNVQSLTVLMQWKFHENSHRNVDGLTDILQHFKRNNYKLYKISNKQENINQQNEFNNMQQINDLIQIMSQLSECYLLFVPVNKQQKNNKI